MIGFIAFALTLLFAGCALTIGCRDPRPTSRRAILLLVLPAPSYTAELARVDAPDALFAPADWKARPCTGERAEQEVCHG